MSVTTQAQIVYTVPATGPLPAALSAVMQKPPPPNDLFAALGLRVTADTPSTTGTTATRTVTVSMVPSVTATGTANINPNQNDSADPDISGVEGAPVLSVSMTAAGADYAAPPFVKFGGPGKDARGKAQLGINAVAVVLGGVGYSANPTVTTVGGRPTKPAILTATVVAGVITGYTVDDPGSGYQSIPTIVIADPTGSGATATANLKVVSVLMVCGGTGYVTVPTVTFVPLFKQFFPDQTQPSSALAFSGLSYVIAPVRFLNPTPDSLDAFLNTTPENPKLIPAPDFTPPGTFTFEFWTLPTGTPGLPILGVGNTNGAGNWFFHTGGAGGHFSFHAVFKKFGPVALANAGAIVPGTWVHVAVTYDNQTLTLWVGGVALATATIGPDSLAPPESVLVFGNTGNRAGTGYDGALTQIRFSDVVRYPGSAAFTPESSFVPDGQAIGYWPVQENGGILVHDVVNSHDATLQDNPPPPTWVAGPVVQMQGISQGKPFGRLMTAVLTAALRSPLATFEPVLT